MRFSQQDKRWKNEKLGHGGETIGSAGCLVCCVAMACQAKGYSETPATINEKFKAIDGGFYGSWIGLPALPGAVPGMQYVYRYQCMEIPAPIAEINKFLQAGQVVAVLVDYDPDKGGIQQHWVILERQAGDDYLILDPWPLNENTGAVTLMGRFGKGKSGPAEAIYDVCVFGGSSPSTSSGTEPVAEPVEATLPKAGDVMKVITDMVNIRLGPSRAALDVGDLKGGDQITLSGDPVTKDGITWVPFTATHWVAMRRGSDDPYLEKVTSAGQGEGQ